MCDRGNRGAVARLRLAVILAVVWLAPALAGAADNGRGAGGIEYGYPEQPPRAYTDANGQAAGFYPRLLDVIFTRAALRWHAVSLPAPRLMKNLQSGETPFSILVKNSELEECCFYSEQPVWYDDVIVYSVGDKPEVRKIEDLAGKDIITLSGYSYGGMVSFFNDPKNRIRNNAAATHEAAFIMLEAGRADYLIDYAEVAASEGLARHPVVNLRQSVLARVYMYFVLSKSFPNAAAFMRRMEALYSALYREDLAGAYTKR